MREELPTQKQEDFAKVIADTLGVPSPTIRTKQAYSRYISDYSNTYNTYKREQQRWIDAYKYNWKNELLNG